MKGPESRGKAREILGFLIVGIAATLTHLCVGLLAFYVLPLGLSALQANLLAFCVAYLVSYFGNSSLAFPETRLGLASFCRFLIVSLVSLSLNQGIVFALVDIVRRPYWQALIVVLMVVPPVTFLAMKNWAVHGMRRRRGNEHPCRGNGCRRPMHRTR